MKWWLAALACVFVVGLGPMASAAPPKERQEAQKIATQARALVKSGKFAEAAKKLKRADALYPSAVYRLEMGKLLLELGDLRQAGRVLRDATEMKAQQFHEKQAQKKARELLAEVEERTPTLRVSVFEPEAGKVHITIDGDEYDTGDGAVPINPGTASIEATATGYEPFSKKVKLVEGKREVVELRLRALAKEEDEGSGVGLNTRIPAYIAWGVGAVGLGLGIGFGIMAINTTNDVVINYDCENNVCPAEAEEDLDTAKANGNVATAGWVIAVAGVAAGTILFLLAKDGDGEEGVTSDPASGALRIEARPLLGPGYVGVTGSF